MALRLTGISTPADSSGTPAGVGLQTFAATGPVARSATASAPRRAAHLRPPTLTPTASCSPAPPSTMIPRPAITPACRLSRRVSPPPARPLDRPGHPAVPRRRHRGDRRARGGAARAGAPRLRRRRLVRALEPRRRPRPVRGGASPRPLAAARTRNLEESQAPRPGPACGPRPTLHSAVPALAATRQRDRRRGRPGHRAHAQPVHDRAGRGGDAPALPGRRPRPRSTRS